MALVLLTFQVSNHPQALSRHSTALHEDAGTKDEDVLVHNARLHHPSTTANIKIELAHRFSASPRCPHELPQRGRTETTRKITSRRYADDHDSTNDFVVIVESSSYNFERSTQPTLSDFAPLGGRLNLDVPGMLYETRLWIPVAQEAGHRRGGTVTPSEYEFPPRISVAKHPQLRARSCFSVYFHQFGTALRCHLLSVILAWPLRSPPPTSRFPLLQHTRRNPYSPRHVFPIQ